MRLRIIILTLLTILQTEAAARDTVKLKLPKHISIQVSDGFILPNSLIRNISTLNTFSLKYGLSARGDSWKDHFFGMPYGGIGVQLQRYYKSETYGKPFSAYLFQGATIKEWSPISALKYEIDLGVSFNWNHYNEKANPNFKLLGSGMNAHLAGSIYVDRKLSRYLNVRAGFNIAHFSNGATRTPNYGINTFSGFFEFAYNLADYREIVKTIPEPPPFEKSKIHDISFFVTGRTISVEAHDGDSKHVVYPDRFFKVAGFNYALLLQNLRRFRWGPSLDILYDEGNKAIITSYISEDSDERSESIRLAPLSKRISIGLSLKGELSMPWYSIFLHAGYDLLKNNDQGTRLYQIYGFKFYIAKKIYSSFGVRCNNLTKSNFLFVNLGYTFGG